MADQLKFSDISECVEAVMCTHCEGAGIEPDKTDSPNEITCKKCKGTGIRPDSNLGELLMLKKLQA